MAVKKLQPTQFPLEFGGLNTAAPPSLVYPDSPDLQNVRFGRTGELLKVAGYTTYNSTAMPGTVMPVTGLFQFNRKDTTTRYTIACSRDRIFLVPTSGAWTALASSLTAGNNDYWDATVFNNEMILTNGVDSPRITDGTAGGTGILTSQAATQVKTSMTSAQSLTYGLHAVSPGTLIGACGASTAGGFDGITQSYDTYGDAWTTKTRGVANRDDGPGFTAYGRVYACTGLLTGPALTATCERYDPTLDVWAGITNITASRHQAVGNGANNGGFVQTGDDNAGASAWTTTNYYYDPALDIWSTKTAFSGTARRVAVGFSMSQSPHVVTGRITAADAFDADHREYNPFTDAWTDLTDITAARSSAGGAEGDDNLGYVMGGFDSGGTHMSTIYSYNRVTNAWATSSATMSVARVVLGSAPDDWWLYMAGGAVSTTAQSTMERYNTSPAAPVAYYVEGYKSYLFLARTSSFPGRMWYSRAGDSRIWDPNAFIDVTKDEGQWITGLFTFDQRFYVTTTDKIYQVVFSVLDPDPTIGDQSVVEVSNVKGCVSNRSIVVTDHGVYYLAEDGIRLFDGARSELISTKIQTTLDGYVDSRNKYCTAVWVRNRDEVWFSMTASGSTHNRIIAYNYRHKKWTLYTHITAESLATVEDANDIDQILFGTGDASDGKIYTAESGTTANGGAISAYYQHGWFGVPMGVHDLSPSELLLYTERTGNHNLTVTFRRNYSTTDEQTETVTLLSGTYPDNYFQDATDIRASIPIAGDVNGHAIGVRYANANASEDFKVYAAAILAHVPPVSIYPT